MISIKTNESEKKSIFDVFYAPSLEHNFRFVWQYLKKGYQVVFVNGEHVIYDKNNSNKFIVTMKMKNNQMFPKSLVS